METVPCLSCSSFFKPGTSCRIIAATLIAKGPGKQLGRFRKIEPAGWKEAVLQKMMPPHNIPIPQLSEETGISEATLYNWRKQARKEGEPVQADGTNPEQWSSGDKFTIVLETSHLSE